MINPLAGEPAASSKLIDPAQLKAAFYSERPDPQIASQRVSFGTSGHRGSSLERSFNEWHILAITQAICAYRKQKGIDGPLFMGIDTHALSAPAFEVALEVLAANDVSVRIDSRYTPTPAISHAILKYNRGRQAGLADGIVITPSHNPPQDGGFKYNPTHGGPAGSEITAFVQDLANQFIEGKLDGVKRISFQDAVRAATTRTHDFIGEYVEGLGGVIDMEVIRASGIKLGVDPLGGAGVYYWGPIADRYGLNLTVVNTTVDPTFRFMTLDWDGKIRMDPSSPYAMRSLIALKDRFDVAFACDPDHDRHGIVTKTAGLMPPNQYLAVCVHYLFTNRDGWSKDAGVGKTVVSSSMIDRVTHRLGRKLVEVPVGFKWFVNGLISGELAFGGEESAGASFLARDGSPWSTDKDGIIAALLSAEITARTGKDPAQIYEDLCGDNGRPVYARVDAAANAAQRARLGKLSPQDIPVSDLAGEKIETIITATPGGDPIGGVKVVTKNAWFAARPSGTEDVYKIYAESFIGAEHLSQIQEQAKAIVAKALDS